MSTFAAGGQNLRSVTGPSSSSKSEYARRYDYSGLDEHIKRQDAVSALRDEKFDALYENPLKAVKAGNRIRDLVSSLRMNDPLATERNPVTVSNPLVKLESESGGTSVASDAGGYQIGAPRGADDELEGAEQNPVVVRNRKNGVGGDPNRFGNIA